MINILCYGDSNTWGYNPYNGSRYDENTRWTCLLQKKLGLEYNTIEAGLNGRTTSIDSQVNNIRNGRKFISYEINTHKPLDILIIMLGTNDLLHSYNLYPEEIARGIETIIVEAKKCMFDGNKKDMKIFVLSPPRVIETDLESPLFMGAEEKCKRLPKCFEEICKLQGCHFINITKEISACEYDGIHLNKESHYKMAEIIYNEIINYKL